MTPAARFARIRRNPSLYPGLADALGQDFPWHTQAASPRSSQALCLSAWGPLVESEARDGVIDRLLRERLPALFSGEVDAADGTGGAGSRSVGTALPDGACDCSRWSVRLEASDPGVLGERGGHASAIDVVLECRDAVVCVESKFLRDAAAGFRGCRQFPEACRGFHGPGSDRSGTDASCRLAVRDGRREARRYWDVATGLFRPEALTPGPGEPGSCPLHRQYQLARTLLYAKALAKAPASAGGAGAGLPAGRRMFAALVIAPAATAGVLERQTTDFAGVLLPEHAGRVAVAHYEDLVRLLLSCGDARAAAVGAFVAALLPARPDPQVAVRTATARELRRRAEAARRERLRGRPS